LGRGVAQDRNARIDRKALEGGDHLHGLREGGRELAKARLVGGWRCGERRELDGVGTDGGMSRGGGILRRDSRFESSSLLRRKRKRSTLRK